MLQMLYIHAKITSIQGKFTLNSDIYIVLFNSFLFGTMECGKPRHIQAFRRGFRELLRLYRLIKNIRSYDRALVEASLHQLTARLTSPGIAEVLMDMGVCDTLVPLLTLKSSKKQVLITQSLSILTILSLTGAPFLRVAKNPLFCSLMHDFLKSKATEQKLAGKIICNMFKQLPVGECILTSNDESLRLLVMTLRLPFMSSILAALTVLDELTYHGPNVELLLGRFGVENELCFFGILEEYVMCDQEDIQRMTLQVILNCISFADQGIIRAAVLHHSLHIEGMLLPVSVFSCFATLQLPKLEIIFTIQLFQEDLALLNELKKGKDPRLRSHSKRTSSTYRLGSSVATKAYCTPTRELHMDLPSPRRVPIAMQIMAISRRRQINMEILWLLCRFHGKVRGSNRSNNGKRSMALHPEDSYDILANLLSGDI